MLGLLKAEDVNKVWWFENDWVNKAKGLTSPITQQTDELLAAALWEEMDDDKDGKIKLEEYINACLNKDELCKKLTVTIIDIFIDDEEKN